MEIKLLTDTMTYVDNLYREGDNKKLSTYPTSLVGITTLPPDLLSVSPLPTRHFVVYKGDNPLC